MNWRHVLKAKTKAQQSLSRWIKEDWGTQTEHRAKDKGKTPKKEKQEGVICREQLTKEPQKEH